MHIYIINEPFSAQGDESVQRLLFLNKRSKSRTAATLVASGPAGVCVCVCGCVRACVHACVCVCVFMHACV